MISQIIMKELWEDGTEEREREREREREGDEIVV